VPHYFHIFAALLHLLDRTCTFYIYYSCSLSTCFLPGLLLSLYKIHPFKGTARQDVGWIRIGQQSMDVPFGICRWSSFFYVTPIHKQFKKIYRKPGKTVPRENSTSCFYECCLLAAVWSVLMKYPSVRRWRGFLHIAVYSLPCTGGQSYSYSVNKLRN
jgi:hypothetical protein